ncbi:hypothetical protein UlMin_025069 [Ulmus minor]
MEVGERYLATGLSEGCLAEDLSEGRLTMGHDEVFLATSLGEGSSVNNKSPKDRHNLKGSLSPHIGNLTFLSSRELFQNTWEGLGRCNYSTSGFSTENLIGYGSFGTVYKGILDGDEKIVAVKVLNLQKKGAIKSFMAECKALRNIRHRNLVKILTSCSSVDYKGNEFKALVFEFMENGNLEKWLHKENEDKNQPRRLSLLQRLDIVIDVASALHYLHDECEQPVIHCDLKPSNVLLDKDMIAHVSDFGIARLLSSPKASIGKQSSTIGLIGSIGYTAPEYGMGGEASIEGDIYSFGVLILEIFTARRPTDQIFKDSYNLHNFVKTALPERLVEITDPILLSMEVEEESPRRGINRNIVESTHEIVERDNLRHVTVKTRSCLLSVLQRGLACSRESANERASMKDVVRELHLTKSAFLRNESTEDGPITTQFQGIVVHF